jgi:hypothetical protein
MRWLWLALPLAAWAAEPDFHIERQPVAGGAELLTVFGSLSERQTSGVVPRDVPLVSILRDTLDDADPSNDRLRYIWVLTSTRPNVLQRFIAALPFFYWRPNVGSSTGSRPAPLLDFADTKRHVWSSLAGSITQVVALDPNGALIRSSTRRYRLNAAEHRLAHLAEGISVLSQLENTPGAKKLISEPELFELQARLSLAGNTLGGLVDDEQLSQAYYKQRARTEEARGHNWELLRQRAEANGLYFEPFGLGSSRTHALLCIAREDLARTTHPFDAKFLDISNPYIDARLKNWQGLTITAYFDSGNRRVTAPVEGGSMKELIPLGLYSLEYPKVPLLLVDFRDTRSPKNREMLRRATTDVIAGVLGISRWGNWPYMAGSMAFNFVRSRHGDPGNRAERLKSFAQTRRWLALDSDLDPALQDELLRRLEVLGVNPMEESVFDEAQIARRQYAALSRYAQDPNGLLAQLQKDRNAERSAYEHSWKARAGFRLANVLTLGGYRHTEPGPSSLLAALDQRRRAALRERAQQAHATAPGSSNAAGD